ncbi:Pre-mRNA splicing factor-domain-containing protein [Lentinula raphanica]|uniref:Pre-mRNA splicing factor-domain-containing protein n=1 Tax=Lentinula raphanica TaxID=153919 RepID=A0AA38P6J0_9AGAR|nr:Pre-mRNA splicing factor-domain-containing protein [Lentinula raphanica]KAJ3974021.1 Pre-mRNA splicing factor-domain-containing protein [Lentinula raphanica]
MGGGDLNMKKSWHPLLLKNQERVWLEEKKALEEKKKLDQLRKEKEEERQLQELQRLQEEKTGKKRTEKLEWMYTTPATGSTQNQNDLEDYLLGKKRVDKILTADENAKLGASHKNFIAVQNANTARDISSKIREDPLLAIKQQEQAAYEALMANPLRLREMQMRNGIVPKKDKKERKREKEEKRRLKEEKKQRKLRDRYSRSPSPLGVRYDDREDDYRRRSSSPYRRSRSPYHRGNRRNDRDLNNANRSQPDSASYTHADLIRSPSPLGERYDDRGYRRRSSIPSRRSTSHRRNDRDFDNSNRGRLRSRTPSPRRAHGDAHSSQSPSPLSDRTRGRDHRSYDPPIESDLRRRPLNSPRGKRSRSPSLSRESRYSSSIHKRPRRSPSPRLTPTTRPDDDRAARLAAMSVNAETTKTERQERLKQLLEKEKADLAAEEAARSKSRGMGGFLSQESKKVFGGTGGLEDRIRRGRGGLVIDAD